MQRHSTKSRDRGRNEHRDEWRWEWTVSEMSLPASGTFFLKVDNIVDNNVNRPRRGSITRKLCTSALELI